MSLSQAGSALSQTSPYSLGWRGLSGYQHSADQTIPSLNNASGASGNSDQVSLSDAARALSANSGSNSSGDSSDFDQEASYLSNITDASLVAMGIITPDQQSGTQISFNSLSYSVSSTTSASLQQQGGQTVAAYGQEQDAQLTGEGQITTADGRTFEFQVEVDLDQSQQVQAASSSSDGSDGGLGSLLGSLGNLLGTPSSASSAAAPGSSSSSSSAAASGDAGSADSINWDAILQQSQSLISMLEEIGKQNIAALNNPAASQASQSNPAASSTSGSTAASAGSSSTASTPVSA